MSSFYFHNIFWDRLSWKKIHVYLAICLIFSLRKNNFYPSYAPANIIFARKCFHQKTVLSRNINRIPKWKSFSNLLFIKLLRFLCFVGLKLTCPQLISGLNDKQLMFSLNKNVVNIR